MKKKPAKRKPAAKRRSAPSAAPAAETKHTVEAAPPSLPIQRILVPIDFSAHSKNALRYAIPMAQQYGATLYLIYVIEPTIYPADLGFGQVVMPGVEDEMRTKSADELKSLIEEEIAGKAKAEAIVCTGKPHQEILKEAEARNVDLIIVASHGHSGVEQILFGSTAMRIVRLAKCPVLTIRPQTT